MNSITIMLTERCNLKCKHCASMASTWTNNRELNLCEYEKLISQAAQLGCKKMVITGGEPLVRKDILFQIIRAANEAGISCVILTNGLLIDSDALNELGKCSKKNVVRFSLEFLENEKMKEFRGVDNIPNYIWETSSKLKSMGIKTGINMAIMKENVAELPYMYQEVKKHGIDYFRAIPIMPIGRATGDQITKWHFADLIYEILSLTTNDNKVSFCSDYDDELNIESLVYGCSGAEKSITIIPDGYAKVCPFSEIKSKDSFHDNMSLSQLISQVQNNKQKIYDAFMYSETECIGCELLEKCKGGCLSEKYCRTSMYNVNQEICLKEIWKIVICRLKENSVSSDILLNTKLKCEAMCMTDQNVCLRTLPVWNM